MKSDNREIVVTRRLDVGSITLPPFITLGAKHVEKELPKPTQTIGGRYYFMVPLDLVRLVLPTELSEEITELTLVYERKGAK